MKSETQAVAAVCDRRTDTADIAPLQKPVRGVKPLLYVYRVLFAGIDRNATTDPLFWFNAQIKLGFQREPRHPRRS